MSAAMSSERAVVRPRVFAPDSGEVLPLEDALQPWLAAQEWGCAAVIVGDAGSGKTTALAYLRSLLDDAEPLQFLDDADEKLHEQLNLQADDGPLAIWTASSALMKVPRSVRAVMFRLAPWQRDDWIEYLLAVHPERCRSVMARLEEAHDRHLMGGNAEMCRIVLDRMVGDESILNVRSALEREIEELFIDAESKSIAERYAIEILGGSQSAPRRLVKRLVERNCGDPALRLLRQQCIRMLLAAGRIMTDLRTGSDDLFRDMRGVFPRFLLRELARSLEQSDRPRLEELRLARNGECNPNVVSVLVASDPYWRPGDKRVGPLACASVAGAQWRGLNLSYCDLSRCDLSRAMLTDARLNQVTARRTQLTNTVMVRVLAEGADFQDSVLNRADLSFCVAPEAKFGWVEAEECNFHAARLGHAQFLNAKLVRANFSQSVLTHAGFFHALVDGADFSDADMQSAWLTGVDLTQANLIGACLCSARLDGSNLEYLELPGAELRKAYIYQSMLTGSRMPRADFRGADLRESGLADIDWEGADLRETDLRGATFHMGSSRSGLVDSFIASEGTRTGYYTDEFLEQHFKSPEEVRKANLCRADLRGARIDGVDFYLADLRGAVYTAEQRRQLEACGAILSDP